MSELAWILGATFTVGILSLIGMLSLWIKEKLLERITFILVAFSAGTLLAGAFFHLLLESLEILSTTRAFVYLFVGFILFFLAERFLYWRHCHDGECDVHTFNYLILYGDGFHNFIDGMIIAVSFMVSIPFGIITTLLLVAHEIPQEIGDFAVLIHGGFSKTKALFYNFLSQITAVAGGLVGFFLSKSVEATIPFLLPFAAGGFIYIAASDLIPELHKEADVRKSAASFIFFVVGVLFMFLMKILFAA